MTTRPVIDCATGQVTVEPIPDNELAMREAAAVAPLPTDQLLTAVDPRETTRIRRT